MCGQTVQIHLLFALELLNVGNTTVKPMQTWHFKKEKHIKAVKRKAAAFTTVIRFFKGYKCDRGQTRDFKHCLSQHSTPTKTVKEQIINA